MPPIRVVILDDHITPYRIPLFEKLSELEWDMTVLYCTKRLRERRWELGDQLAFRHHVLPNWVIQFPKRDYQHEPRSIIINPTLPLMLISLKPDIVVGYAFSLPAWIAFLYAWLFGKKFVSWSTDTLHTEGRLSWLQRLTRQIIIPRAHACVTPSFKGREKFLAYGVDPASIFVVPQSPPTSYPDQRIPGCAADLFADSAASRKDILYVGFLSKLKGVDCLLEAFGNVHRSLPDTRLILIGHGHLEAALKERARQLGLQNSVIFGGFRPPEHLPEIYARAQVFVFPTFGDTYGAALGEAAMSGLPLICSQYAGAADIYVQHGTNGYIVDPANIKELTTALIDTLSDEDRRLAMSSHSRAIAECYSLEASFTSFSNALNHASQG